MHIDVLYLSTYNPQTPISGHMEVKADGTKIRVEFSTDEAADIQAIAVRAWLRKQRALAEAILASTPALVALAPPSEAVDAEFTEVSDDVCF